MTDVQVTPVEGLRPPGEGPVDDHRPTRPKLSLWDRTKFLLLFAVVWFVLVWAMMADNPLVPFADAARSAGRAALLPLALAGEFDLLLPATDDLLHQPARLAARPDSARVVEGLRARGHAAFLSGAGPSVLALVPRAGADAALHDAAEVAGDLGGWRALRLEIARSPAVVELSNAERGE
jgi:homoserine kinase